MAKFTPMVKEKAWTLLQQEISVQLNVTPGEYDVINLIDKTSRTVANDCAVDYAKIEDYLKHRYVGLE